MAKKDTATNSSNERMNDAVNKLNNNKNVIENSKPTEYHHGTGTATLSPSGKVLHFKKDGQHVRYEQDPKKIAHYVAQRKAAEEKKKVQDLAREVQEINPTKDQLANRSAQTRTEESMERVVVANRNKK